VLRYYNFTIVINSDTHRPPFFCGVTSQLGPRLPSLLRILDHTNLYTQTHTRARTQPVGLH